MEIPQSMRPQAVPIARAPHQPLLVSRHQLAMYGSDLAVSRNVNQRPSRSLRPTLASP